MVGVALKVVSVACIHIQWASQKAMGLYKVSQAVSKYVSRSHLFRRQSLLEYRWCVTHEERWVAHPHIQWASQKVMSVFKGSANHL